MRTVYELYASTVAALKVTAPAPDDGAVVLPLYQRQGSDGFFWARAVSEGRLRLAAALRALPVDAVVRRLPGIHGDAARPHPRAGAQRADGRQLCRAV